MLSEYLFYRLGKRRARKVLARQQRYLEDDMETLKYMLDNPDMFSEQDVDRFIEELYD